MLENNFGIASVTLSRPFPTPLNTLKRLRHHLICTLGLTALAVSSLTSAHAQTAPSTSTSPISAPPQSRTILPIPTPPFQGQITPFSVDSQPQNNGPVQAPAGAPNMFVLLSDDVGFGIASAFGGPVPTPNLDRIANQGQRYNRFHTTAICSPTRAALLTGRNHHNAGVGFLSDQPDGFPGYAGKISPETASIAQILTLNGYNTAMFGKHHNSPSNERSLAGPFDSWPTGIGFEYFYGFNAGDTDQYKPNLYRGTTLQPAPKGDTPLLEKRLADDAISWIHNQNAANASKPFFIYYSTGSLHAPHQVPAEYTERFKGQFDQGWDKVREETHQRQLANGIIPADTKLTPRPDSLPAWDSLSPDARIFAIRSMEVAAGMLAYQDEQLGRIFHELERMGQYDNTLFALVIGDNGGAAETGPDGSVNELQKIGGGLQESAEWLASNVSKLGGPQTYGAYPAGWAWATNAPFPQMKQYASDLGGIRNGFILSWGNKAARPGSVCARFGHVNDIAPTLLDAAGLPTPTSVLGTPQKPMDGQSLIGSLSTCEADTPRTQYFEIAGKKAIYHNGWFASDDPGRAPWEKVSAGDARPASNWRLYDLNKDFSQSTDLAAQNPAKLNELIQIFEQEAHKNNVYPIEPRFGMARVRPGSFPKPPERLDFWGKTVSVPAQGGPFPMARSFQMDATLDLNSPRASGVVAALGSQFAGWSVHIDKGYPVFSYARSTMPEDIYSIRGTKRLPAGASKLSIDFALERPGGAAAATLRINDEVVGQGAIARTFGLPSGLGEMLDIGRDTGVTVTTYSTPLGEIEGDISHVGFTFRQK